MQFLTKRGFRIIFLREGERERKKSAQCFIFHVHSVPNLSKGMVEYLVAPASSRITHPHPAFFHCSQSFILLSKQWKSITGGVVCEVLVDDGAIKGATRGRKNGRSKYKIIVGFQFQWNRDHTLTRNTHTHTPKKMDDERSIIWIIHTWVIISNRLLAATCVTSLPYFSAFLKIFIPSLYIFF